MYSILQKLTSLLHSKCIFYCINPLLRAIFDRVRFVSRRSAGWTLVLAKNRTHTIPPLILEGMALVYRLCLAVVLTEFALDTH